MTTPEALKAELDAIAARGHAYDREEHEPGIICIAVPIVTDAGRVLGGLSITGSTQTTTMQALEALVPQLRATAQDIADDGVAWRFPGQEPLQQTGT